MKNNLVNKLGSVEYKQTGDLKDSFTKPLDKQTDRQTDRQKYDTIQTQCKFLKDCTHKNKKRRK